MEDALDTRTLKGLTATVFTAGCAIAAITLLPAVDRPTVSRAGILLAIAMLPTWTAVNIRQARDTVDDQIADAHVAGYQLALKHMTEATEPPEDRPAQVWGQRVGHTERHDR